MLGVTFGRPEEWPSQDLIGYSDEFGPTLALESYRCGAFPMPIGVGPEMGWWSPVQRGLLPVHGLHVTRSLRKNAKHYSTTVDADFDAVIEACANPDRPDGWIDTRIKDVYRTLHGSGWAHSVEVWDYDGLVGGLYGVHIGGLFAGESMFHDPERGRDASKVALMRLVQEVAAVGVTLIDVQWLTEHLGSLGAYEVPREEYLRRLDVALHHPTFTWNRRGRLSGAQLLAGLQRQAPLALRTTPGGGDA